MNPRLNRPIQIRLLALAGYAYCASSLQVLEGAGYWNNRLDQQWSIILLGAGYVSLSSLWTVWQLLLPEQLATSCLHVK